MYQSRVQWERLNNSAFVQTAVVLLLLCSRYPANAADIFYSEPGTECYLEISGEITQGDDVKLYDKISEGRRSGCHDFAVALVSPGGDLATAIKMGRQVRAVYATTYAPFYFSKRCSVGGPRPSFRADSYDQKTCVCASACFLVWAGGGYRGGAQIYIHRPTFNLEQSKAEPTPKAYAEVLRHSRSYLVDMDVPTSVIDRMFATPSTAVSQLTDLERMQMATTPYYDEIVASQTLFQCGAKPPDTKGLSDAEELRLFSLALEHDRCRWKVIEGIVAKSWGQFAEAFEPIYGSEVAKLRKGRLDRRACENLRWLFEQTGGPPKDFQGCR